MKRKKRSRILLIITLLIVAAIGTWFFICGSNKVSQKNFVQQGSTTIKTNSPTIKIWDYSAVDGDTIDFYFDGKLIYKNLFLQDSPNIYQPNNLSKGEHWIGIKAIAEGTNPPATPHISIGDGVNDIQFDVDAYKDSVSGSWLINVE